MTKSIHTEAVEMMQALGPEITRALVVRVHLHPVDFKTLEEMVPPAKHDAVDELVPPPWTAGTIVICIGQPVRRGLARAERADGIYEWIDLKHRSDKWRVPGRW